MAVYVLATLDTKGTEAEFVCQLLRQANLETLLVDTGCMDAPQVQPDVSREQIYQAAGTTLETTQQKADRGFAVTKAAEGAANFIQEQAKQGSVCGVLGLGGSAGTTIGTAAMRALPLGVPKVMLSTLASGQVRPYVGDRDLLMINSVVDIAGVNRISRIVLSEAAYAMIGLVRGRDTQTVAADDKPVIAATMFGVTTRCVEQARLIFEQAGYEVLVFHATGTGGQAMESLIADGLISGVFDLTTTELADELVGGVLSAGPNRLTAAGKLGIPQVISVGALDMVNFGAPDTIPAQFQNRQFYQHNPTVTLMRTTAEENAELGKILAEKASASMGPTKIMLPRHGVSAIDCAGLPFDDPQARATLFEAIKQNVEAVDVQEIDAHINDALFAETAAKQLLELIATHHKSKEH